MEKHQFSSIIKIAHRQFGSWRQDESDWVRNRFTKLELRKIINVPIIGIGSVVNHATVRY